MEVDCAHLSPRPAFVRSCSDRVLLSQRVLDNLLASEVQYKNQAGSGDYMSRVQAQLLVHHRKIVTDWMLELCQDHCSGQVFLSAVMYLDTVLSQISVSTSQLQLLAAACLSIASKLSDPRPLSLYKLVIFTDCSVSLTELQNMEMLVLQKLRWELSAPTSLDFLSQLLSQLEHLTSPHILKMISKQSETFLMLAATEYKFYNVRPSVMASAAILSSIGQLAGNIDSNISNQISSLAKTHQNYLRQIVRELSQHIQHWIRLTESGEKTQPSLSEGERNISNSNVFSVINIT